MAGDKGPFGMPGMQGMRVSYKEPRRAYFSAKITRLISLSRYGNSDN